MPGIHARPDAYHLPSHAELGELFRQKYGPPEAVGSGPRRRWQFGYHLPADVYEALVSHVVYDGCAWIDIGGGRDIFPDNPTLARALAARCSVVVAVDPSENVHQNVYVHERAQCVIEAYEADRQFDVATLRMVAEHVAEPEQAVQALHRLVRPGGIAIVFTVNVWSPLTLVSRLTPFRLHHPIKKLIWGTEEEDTFPIQYKMNSRRTLRRLFAQHGFREVAFAHLDDLSAGSRFKSWNYLELWSWRVFQGLKLHYPENCLLGVYQK